MLVLILTLGMSMTAFAGKKNGWVKANDATYYYVEGKMVKGWKTIEGKKYFFLKTGKMAIGRYIINKEVYYFNTKGVFVKKMQGAKWVENKKGRRFDNGNGRYIKGQWKYIQGRRYYFDAKGYVLAGMNTIENFTYYFNSKGKLITSKWVRYNGGIYYFGADGKMARNTWIEKRYVGDDGRVISDYVDETRDSKTQTGWVGYGRLWKYYAKGKMVTGWKVVNGKRYLFQSSGYIKIGWHNDGKDYYFLNTTPGRTTIGVMATNFMRIDGKVYYFFPKKVKDSTGAVHPIGSMARNLKIKYNDKLYSFDAKGVCQELK